MRFVYVELAAALGSSEDGRQAAQSRIRPRLGGVTFRSPLSAGGSASGVIELVTVPSNW